MAVLVITPACATFRASQGHSQLVASRSARSGIRQVCRVATGKKCLSCSCW